MSSAFSNLSVVDEYFKKELDRGSNTGPFSDDPINRLYSNRFGLIPNLVKGEWRMIIDLSFPRGNSINDFIPVSVAMVKYTSVDDAIALTIKCGRGALDFADMLESILKLCAFISFLIHYLNEVFLTISWYNGLQR